MNSQPSKVVFFILNMEIPSLGLKMKKGKTSNSTVQSAKTLLAKSFSNTFDGRQTRGVSNGK